MHEPLISTVIPARNVERYLADAVQSILKQKYEMMEVIIVDDGSTDRTLEVAESFKPDVRVISQPQRGHAAARNHGLLESHGELLSFCDADDLWADENRLKKQVEALADDRHLDMVFGHLQAFRGSDWAERGPPPPECRAAPQPGPVVGTILIRSDAFHRVGGFDESSRLGVFVDWYTRARELGLKERMLTDVLLYRRIHRENTSATDTGARSQYARVLKKALDRRRNKPDPE